MRLAPQYFQVGDADEGLGGGAGRFSGSRNPRRPTPDSLTSPPPGCPPLPKSLALQLDAKEPRVEGGAEL